MKKNFLIPCLCILYFTQYSFAQRIGPGKPIVQSPYYDALVLYYAFQNINAYPLPSNAIQIGNLQNGSGNNPNKPTQPIPPGTGGNPLFNPASTTDSIPLTVPVSSTGTSLISATGVPSYTIVESSSGKILLDEFTGNLDSV